MPCLRACNSKYTKAYNLGPRAMLQGRVLRLKRYRCRWVSDGPRGGEAGFTLYTPILAQKCVSKSEMFENIRARWKDSVFGNLQSSPRGI